MNPTTDSEPRQTPTTYGVQPGFDYAAFAFSDDFPIPDVYVMADGFPHFRGPDGHLWFTPDAGEPGQPQWMWEAAQNVADHDIWQEGEGERDPRWLAMYARLGHTIDHAEAYARLCQAIDGAEAYDREKRAWKSDSATGLVT